MDKYRVEIILPGNERHRAIVEAATALDAVNQYRADSGITAGTSIAALLGDQDADAFISTGRW